MLLCSNVRAARSQAIDPAVRIAGDNEPGKHYGASRVSVQPRVRHGWQEGSCQTDQIGQPANGTREFIGSRKTSQERKYQQGARCQNRDKIYDAAEPDRVPDGFLRLLTRLTGRRR